MISPFHSQLVVANSHPKIYRKYLQCVPNKGIIKTRIKNYFVVWTISWIKCFDECSAQQTVSFIIKHFWVSFSKKGSTHYIWQLISLATRFWSFCTLWVYIGNGSSFLRLLLHYAINIKKSSYQHFCSDSLSVRVMLTLWSAFPADI